VHSHSRNPVDMFIYAGICLLIVGCLIFVWCRLWHSQSPTVAGDDSSAAGSSSSPGTDAVRSSAERGFWPTPLPLKLYHVKDMPLAKISHKKPHGVPLPVPRPAGSGAPVSGASGSKQPSPTRSESAPSGK